MKWEFKNKIEGIEGRKEFLVCLDSDGTVFNTMDIKHKECVIPAMISEWGLQDISSYVRETAEYVNLYSKYRGINRFKALTKVFDLLSENLELKNLGYKFPTIDSLREWVKHVTRLDNESLEEIIAKTQDPVLKKTLSWTKTVDKYVSDKLSEIRPFPFVSESLEKISKYADIIVVSSESGEILAREWEENGLLGHVYAIAGRETGSKNEILSRVRATGYKGDSILMMGDAPGDLKAACTNSILFYPINPKLESDSWQRFFEEAFGKFINGCYSGSYQDNLVSEYEKSLDMS